MLMLSALPKPRRFRLILRALFVSLGIAAAFVASYLFEEKKYCWALIPGTVVLLASLAEFVLADILTESLYPPETQQILDKLEEHLRGYHDQIHDAIERGISSLRACDQNQVSGTFHLRVSLFGASGEGSEQALVQVVDYSGRLGGNKWRFNAATKGLVGRCLRTGNPEWVNFASEEEYRDRMVKEFGFTPAEVERHTREARSYWAQPVKLDGQLIGVLYLFSTEVQVFPRAVNRSLLEATANEIAAFLAGARIIA